MRKKVNTKAIKKQRLKRPPIEVKKRSDEDISDSDYKDAIIKWGTIPGVAYELGIGYTVANYRIKKIESLLQLLKDVRDEIEDTMESYSIHNIFKLIVSGDKDASKFYLTRKCGWVERKEITGKDGGPIESVENEANRMTKEELKSEIHRLNLKAGYVKIKNIKNVSKK